MWTCATGSGSPYVPVSVPETIAGCATAAEAKRKSGTTNRSMANGEVSAQDDMHGWPDGRFPHASTTRGHAVRAYDAGAAAGSGVRRFHVSPSPTIPAATNSSAMNIACVSPIHESSGLTRICSMRKRSIPLKTR